MDDGRKQQPSASPVIKARRGDGATSQQDLSVLSGDVVASLQSISLVQTGSTIGPSVGGSSLRDSWPALGSAAEIDGDWRQSQATAGLVDDAAEWSVVQSKLPRTGGKQRAHAAAGVGGVSVRHGKGTRHVSSGGGSGSGSGNRSRPPSSDSGRSSARYFASGGGGGYGSRSGDKRAVRSKPKIPLTDDAALVSRRLNVHEDDIHGLIVVNDSAVQTLVSGSKDCTVKQFSADGAFIKDLISRPKKASYARWVTGLSGFSDNSMVTGFRNGWLNCMDTGGTVYYSRMAEVTISGGGAATADQAKKGCYKQRNQLRITGITCLDNYTALIGATDHILCYDFNSNNVLGEFTLTKPEWVYGFERIDDTKVVYIHAGSLSLFDIGSMTSGDLLVAEPYAKRGEKREHISSVKRFEGTGLYALSCFKGVTKMFDLERKKIIHKTLEHRTDNPEKERVWQALPLPGSQTAFASCADDATIKLWDIRTAKSIRTIAGHPGRVSSMCFLNESRLVAGTCPDDVHSDPDKAQFCFYDLRK